MKRLFVLLVLLLPLCARAGGDCSERTVNPLALSQAADSALRAVEALERTGRPIALIARVGADLSKHGLVYSHAGFVLRDHVEGRWSVVHLLNECGSDRSGVYVDGLVNFFADDLLRQDIRIAWFDDAFGERLEEELQRADLQRLHQPRYNLLARPGSARTQNSTAWVLEVLGAALPGMPAAAGRDEAYAAVVHDRFVPDTVHVPYRKRLLGGLFSANTDFTDHSVSTRLRGDYPVVTVRAILRYATENGHILRQREWRDGRWIDAPGPA